MFGNQRDLLDGSGFVSVWVLRYQILGQVVLELAMVVMEYEVPCVYDQIYLNPWPGL